MNDIEIIVYGIILAFVTIMIMETWASYKTKQIIAKLFPEEEE
jgi:hypothetical protein